MHIRGLTDKGKLRKNNQDHFYIDPFGVWCLVADGMGGHQGGETASALAVETVRRVMSVEHGGIAGVPAMETEALMLKAIEQANEAVYHRAMKEPSLHGMGTTAVLLYLEGSDAVIAHVGDSRAYHIATGDADKSIITQLTHDHSIVQKLLDSGSITKEEARIHPQKNLITRAVGTDPNVRADLLRVPIKEGDFFLLCTDGLTCFIDDETIHEIILQNGISAAPEELIRLANERGGEDNITAVLVQIPGGRNNV